MVRKLVALFALVLTLGMAVSPVAAQDVSMDDFEEFGLTSGYFRGYVNPAADAEIMMKMVGGFEFEDEDVVEENFEEFACGFAAGFSGSTATDCDSLGEADVTVSDVDNIGDEAMGFAGPAEGMNYEMLIIRDGNFIFVVVGLGETVAEGSMDDLGKFMVDAEPVDTEVQFSEDGTSTGGFFDMLPTADDDVIAGYEPAVDMDILDAATSTPAS